jgi:thioesterase domain-containing protein
MPADYSLYGLQAPELHAAGQPHRSLEEMAAAYIHAIRSVQDSGPYHLVGWSFGGNVAHEMAVQLQAVGEQTALIIMDGYPAEPENADPPGQPADSATEAARETGSAPDLRSVGDHDTLIAQLRDELSAALSATLADAGPLARITAQVLKNNTRLRQNHTPGRFTGDLLLITAEDTAQSGQPPGSRWAPHISGDIMEVPLACSHAEMTSPTMLSRIWDAIADWLGTGRR